MIKRPLWPAALSTSVLFCLNGCERRKLSLLLIQQFLRRREGRKEGRRGEAGKVEVYKWTRGEDVDNLHAAHLVAAFKNTRDIVPVAKWLAWPSRAGFMSREREGQQTERSMFLIK